MFKELKVLKIIYTEMSKMSKDKKAQPLFLVVLFKIDWLIVEG
jgi:hypothetical protein